MWRGPENTHNNTVYLIIWLQTWSQAILTGAGFFEATQIKLQGHKNTRTYKFT